MFLWTLVPIITRTTAYHLVFMTALEFVSAQAPLKMKGSLICLWYAFVCFTISHTSCTYILYLQRRGLVDVYWSESLYYAVCPMLTAIGGGGQSATLVEEVL